MAASNASARTGAGHGSVTPGDKLSHGKKVAMWANGPEGLSVAAALAKWVTRLPYLKRSCAGRRAYVRHSGISSAKSVVPAEVET